MNIVNTDGLTKDQVFALRGYGASDSPIIAGHGYSGSSRLKLWFEKREGKQEEADDFTQNLFWWGNELEPVIAKRFTLDTGLKFASHQVLVAHPEYPWMTALIDGVTESGEIVDFKAMTYYGARDLEGGDPTTLGPRHHLQAQHQMAVCDVDHAHWACFAGSELRLKHFRIERDDELIDTLITLLSEFREQVELGIMPTEFDPSDNEFLKRRFSRVYERAVVIENTKTIETAKRYMEAKEAEKYAKTQQEELQAELRVAVGEASLARIGPYTIKRSAIERKAYSVAATTYVDFRVTLPKEKK